VVEPSNAPESDKAGWLLGHKPEALSFGPIKSTRPSPNHIAGAAPFVQNAEEQPQYH
jgi:hypothetical protein